MALCTKQQPTAICTAENEEGFLYCNILKCGAKITERYLWLTFCSHVFCDRHGLEISRLPLSKLICPACKIKLPSHADIIRVDSQPERKVLKMKLCGLRPSQCLVAAESATSFWLYQAHCMKSFREMVHRKCEEQLQETKAANKHLVENLEQQIRLLKLENEELKRKAETWPEVAESVRSELDVQEEDDDVFRLPFGLRSPESCFTMEGSIFDLDDNESTFSSRFYDFV